MTIIEQIKAEIERLYNNREAPKHDQQCDFDDGYFTGIGAISQFLDTLESEKPMNGLEEEIERYLSTELELDEDLNKDEPIYIYDCTWEDLKILARHFAQWGAEHLATSGKTLEIKPGDEITINGHKIVYDKDKGYVTIVESPVPNDLEEAAEKYLDELFGKGKHQPFYKELFIAGAKWQAEQLLKSSPMPEDTILFNRGVEEGKRLMMEEAVEYEVWDFSSSLEAYPHVNIPLDNKQYRSGDKVRVIVCKEELIKRIKEQRNDQD